MKIADGELRQILAYDLKLPAQTVRELVADSKQTGHSLLRTALASSLVDEANLARAQAKRLGLPFVDLTEITIPSKALHRLPHQIAAKYHVICFEETATSLKVAMADPRDERARKALKDYSGKTIRRYQASTKGLVSAIRKYRRPELPIHFSTRDLLITILEQAHRNGSRDIHLQLHDSELIIKRRAGKRLEIMSKLPAGRLRALLSWCRLQTGNTLDETGHLQHGSFTIQLDGQLHEVAMSIIPAVGGEKMVLRLVPSAHNLPSFKELGYSTAQVQQLSQLVVDGRGLMVVAGATGTEVATTLAALSKLAASQAHTTVTSVEEPVTYRVPSVTQVEVTHALPFADIVSAVIAQNPSTIITSQLGKSAAAEQLIDFALSQHLVISGLYAPTMVRALQSLMRYPLAPALIAASLRLVVVQHLIASLCDSCRVTFKPSGPLKKALQKQFSFDDDIQLFRQGDGCSNCHKGLQDHALVIEWLPVTKELQQLLATKADTATIQDYVAQHSNLAQQLGKLASKGQISIDAATDLLAAAH